LGTIQAGCVTATCTLAPDAGATKLALVVV
jgi:hypothetical protein